MSLEAELAGLDISEHGMYGYPEQSLSDVELPGITPPPARSIKLGAGRAPAPYGEAVPSS